MPRNMSFALTTDQRLNRTKTVTRRTGWLFLKPGDKLWAVKKARGLKKGEKVERLALIEIVDVRREQIVEITREDVAAEGFPGWARHQFTDMYCAANKCDQLDFCTRIEFRYAESDGV